MHPSRIRGLAPLAAWLAGTLLALAACGGRPAEAGAPSVVVDSGVAGGLASGAGTGGAASASPTPIPVVGAENFYGDLLTQICGARCAVTTILSDPKSDPHEYESTARDAAAVARARLVLFNGGGYDAFMNRLLAASPGGLRQVVDVHALIGAGEGANPHFWYDPGTMPRVAQAVAEALGRVDPGHAADYLSAARRYTDSLRPLQEEISAIQTSYRGTPVAYTEPVFGYMGDALGLKVLTPASFQKAVEDGNDPAAADLALVQDLLKRHRVRLLIYNLQTVTPFTANLRDLARSYGVAVVGVTETLPPGQTYQQWILGELRQIQTALAEGAPAGEH